VRTPLEPFRWQVWGEAGDGREAVEKAKELRPDVVILDLHMPSLNGSRSPDPASRAPKQILVLTVTESGQMVQECHASEPRLRVEIGCRHGLDSGG